mmetsp:Transcript_20770/g.45706  ORF Transcript_20770/g.45706 Transcript_20770/m.45706 type:complete len:290 (-) Transcript_20770:256-1125(-)
MSRWHRVSALSTTRRKGFSSGQPRSDLRAAVRLQASLQSTKQHVGAEDVLAAIDHLSLLLDRTEFTLRIEESKACLGLEDNGLQAEWHVKDAQSALELLFLSAIEKYPEGVLGDSPILPPDMLVCMATRETSLHVLLYPDDIVQATWSHAVNGDTPQEPAKAADLPERIHEVRIYDVRPLKVQHILPLLRLEALSLCEVDDLPALFRRKESGQSDTVDVLEILRLGKSLLAEHGTHEGTHLRLHLQDMRFPLLLLLGLSLRHADRHIDLDLAPGDETGSLLKSAVRSAW